MHLFKNQNDDGISKALLSDNSNDGSFLSKASSDRNDLAQLQEATMRNLLIQKLNEGDLDSLNKYHAFLSEQYGLPLGVFGDDQFEEKIKKKLSKIDHTWIASLDQIIDDIRREDSQTVQMVQVQHR